jgi:hypothetical protein
LHEDRDPVDELARRRALAQARHGAKLVEGHDGLVDEGVLDARVMHTDNALHQLLIGEVDEVKDAAPQERVRQLLLVVRRDDDDRALLRDDLVSRLGDDEAHAIDLVEQVVGELEVRLVHLVDEEDLPLLRRKRATEGPHPDVPANVLHVAVAEASVVEALDGVVHVEPVLRAGRGLHGPVHELERERVGDGASEEGLAGPGLALHEQRALQREGAVDRRFQGFVGQIARSACEASKRGGHPWGDSTSLNRSSLGARSVCAASELEVPRIVESSRVAERLANARQVPFVRAHVMQTRLGVSLPSEADGHAQESLGSPLETPVRVADSLEAGPREAHMALTLVARRRARSLDQPKDLQRAEHAAHDRPVHPQLATQVALAPCEFFRARAATPSENGVHQVVASRSEPQRPKGLSRNSQDRVKRPLGAEEVRVHDEARSSSTRARTSLAPVPAPGRTFWNAAIPGLSGWQRSAVGRFVGGTFGRARYGRAVADRQ